MKDKAIDYNYENLYLQICLLAANRTNHLTNLHDNTLKKQNGQVLVLLVPLATRNVTS